jgi:hypothetical protein
VLGDAAEAHHDRRLWSVIRRRGRASQTGREQFRLVEVAAVPTMADFRPALDLKREHGAGGTTA